MHYHQFKLPLQLKKAALFALFLAACAGCMDTPISKLSEASEHIKLDVAHNNSPQFADYLGVNGFEWDFTESHKKTIDTVMFKNIQSFGGFRHYLDWDKIEAQKDTFNFNGAFNYDTIYQA